MRSKNINHYNQVTKALTICLCGLLGIVSLSAAVLSSIKVNADGDTYSVTDEMATSIPAACSMNGTGTDSHNATLAPGTYSAASGSPYENGIGSTTITAFCNDPEGFAIYAIGFSGDTPGGTNLAGTNTGSTIATKPYEQGDTTSNWSMKVDKITDSSAAYMPTYMYIDNNFNTGYKAVPSTYTEVAHYQAPAGAPSATDTTLGAKLTTTYAAYISNSQVADTYNGKVKYIMVHPNSFVAGTYTIAYNANGGTGTMTSETGVSNMAEHTLKANTFTAPSGYGFAGWCTVQDSGANPQTTCSGTSYADKGTVPPSTVGNGGTLTLYAYWSLVPYMQDLDSTSIASLLPNVGDTATVYDNRDEQAYTIAKLADNKYWMVENLNLAGGTALSADDTDVDGSYISSFSTSNRLTKSGSTIVLPASSTSGFNTADYSYVYNSGNKEDCGASGQNTPCYSYYSWDAATLGSGRSISTDNTDASYSICPKGWRLPKSRTTSATNWQTTSDFYALAHQYGLDSTTSDSESDSDFFNQAGPGTMPSFLLAGVYYSGSFYSGGSDGYYWSSTSASRTTITNARGLSFYSTSVLSANRDGRSNGYSVRCLLDS